MNGETRPSEQPLVTDIAFEVLGLLMLNKYLLIIKLSVAVPLPLCQRTRAHSILNSNKIPSSQWSPLIPSYDCYKNCTLSNDNRPCRNALYNSAERNLISCPPMYIPVLSSSVKGHGFLYNINELYFYDNLYTGIKRNCKYH